MPPMPLVSPPPSSRDLIFDDGEPLESNRHRQQMNVLIDTLDSAWADRDDVFVGGNMFLYYSETQSRRVDFRGPDVFVVLGTTRKDRKGWVVWEEDGKLPDVIIELLSESTEHIDRHDKMRLYSQTLKVSEYFLYDPWSEVFEGYSLNARRGVYERKTPNDRGWLECERCGYWLGIQKGIVRGVEAPWLRWIDRQGRVLPTDEEARIAEAERANAEAERANAEAERANAEAERASRLAAEVDTLRSQLAKRHE